MRHRNRVAPDGNRHESAHPIGRNQRHTRYGNGPRLQARHANPRLPGNEAVKTDMQCTGHRIRGERRRR